MRTSPLHHLAALLAGLLISVTAHAIPGLPGTLDASWGTLSVVGPGKVLTPVGADDDTVLAMVVQPDGKVVVAGHCVNTNLYYAFCAARYNADGTLDTSFNITGKVVTVIGVGNAQAKAVVLQADGKLVLAGTCFNGTNTDFCALRYKVDGTLDTNFNSTGKVVTAMSTSGLRTDAAAAVVVQPDGKIVLAGSCYGDYDDFCALRYNTDGTLDLPFGGSNTGKVFTSIGANYDNANALALQPDGKLVLGGTCSNGVNDDFCAIKYNADGTLDTAGFGTGGKVISAIGGSDEHVNAIALQPDGKIVLAGYCHAAGTSFNFFCAQRLLSNGAPDTSFGNPATGAVITLDSFTPDRLDRANGVVVQPDGKILLGGSCNIAAVRFCALRYHSDGSLDLSFNGSGKVITLVTGLGTEAAWAMALQADGKLLLAGSCYSGVTSDFCSMRYDGGPFGYQNCKPDIDGDGRMTATIDGLINMRVMLGISGPAVINGITFPANATRNTWPLIRDYLVSQCGMSLQL